ncbi:MAG TPA: hypothetical protein VGO47_09675 [Chlamydiales bacterium]|nr:hypothetical protein [Chlamydiales bacterium]
MSESEVSSPQKAKIKQLASIPGEEEEEEEEDDGGEGTKKPVEDGKETSSSGESLEEDGLEEGEVRSEEE